MGAWLEMGLRNIALIDKKSDLSEYTSDERLAITL